MVWECRENPWTLGGPLFAKHCDDSSGSEVKVEERLMVHKETQLKRPTQVSLELEGDAPPGKAIV